MSRKPAKALTNKNIQQLLTTAMRQINEKQKQRPDLILSAWPTLIGERLAKMTKAHSFDEGILLVKVRNSPLLSLLNSHEKPRLLKELRQKFPSVSIHNIRFIIG